MNVLLRYNSNGVLDKSFGDNGRVITGPDNNDYYYPNVVSVQDNGCIIVNTPQKLQRYLSNGKIDRSFGTNGTLLQPNINESLIFTLNKSKLYAVGTTVTNTKVSVITNAYNFSNGNNIAANDSELLTRKAKVAETNSPPLKLYPNPVRDKLIITGLNSNSTTNLQLTDANGRTIREATTQSNTYQWNIQMLTPGIYFLNIIIGKEAPVTFKVIKQ